MRVAIVHDWLYTIGGAERVLREMLRCYPGADVFALFDTLSDQERAWIGFERSRTTFLQHIPRIGRIHRSLLPLMPLAIEQLDLSAYDLVISSSYAVAKGVITGPDQVHVSYVHSPMRYAWDLQHQYLEDFNGLFGLKRTAARLMLHRIRQWDASSASRPNVVLSNSAYIARRIKKCYGRDAQVVYPPVDIATATTTLARGNFFLMAGRLVSYKNVGAVVEAFRHMPELELVVAGTGPEEKHLRAIAGSNVRFAGFVTDSEMRRLMATARALVFAAEEDFGIVPVETQAEGTPVIALGRGGARESVVADGPAATGVFFERATTDSIVSAVRSFEVREPSFSVEACRRQAGLFSAEHFRARFKAAVEQALADSRAEIRGAGKWRELPGRRLSEELRA